MKTFKQYADINPDGCERMHVGISTEIREAEVSGKFRMVEFKELDNNQFICLVPSLNLIAKSDTKIKSLSLLTKSLDNFCHSLTKLSQNKIHSELSALGWVNNGVFKKNYSHLYINQYGVLRSFNVNKHDVVTEMLELIS